jgi:hypothetical protein
MSTILPPGGLFKAMEDATKIVQTELNDLQKKYDMIFLDSQFRDKIEGSVLCVLVYIMEKPKKSAMPLTQQNINKVTSKLQPAASELSAPSGVKSGDMKVDDDVPWKQ